MAKCHQLLNRSPSNHEETALKQIYLRALKIQEFGSMQSKSKSASQVEANPYNISPSAVCAEPWWRSTGYNYVPPAVIGGNTSNSSSLEQSKDGQSQSDGALDEDEDDAIRESQISASPRSSILQTNTLLWMVLYILNE
ncbi:hypothetical protein CsSME_00047713 [Camellia sinensis var. sinensis]